MSIELAPATPEMFEDVYPVLAVFEKNNPRLQKRHFRNLFHYPWAAPDDRRGYVLKDDGRVVGFQALIAHERLVEGRRVPIANFSSWVVLPGYRAYSMLLNQIPPDPELTVTSLTPLKQLEPYQRSVGALPLETRQRVILPVPSLSRIFSGAGWKVTSRIEQHRAVLTEQEWQIYQDHRPLECRHLLAFKQDRHCYLVSVRMKGRRRYFSHLLHVGDPDVFVEALEKIRIALLFQNRTPLIILDERLLHGRPTPASRPIALHTPRVFKSSVLTAEQLDNLYSEFVLLPF
ncbi:MAG: hypothetical protein WDN28_26375 [Chthoniobacter sp.]